jgi:two-component system, cell cycle response regulator
MAAIPDVPEFARRSSRNIMYNSHAHAASKPLSTSRWMPIFEPNCKLAGNERRNRPGEFRRVLIAERDRSLRAYLQKMLCGWGFDVVLAKNGAEAFEILGGQSALDLAILGSNLAEVDRVELCRRINERPCDRTPYLLVLANRDETADMVEALECGADGCLSAPIEERELKARLAAASRILKRRDDLIMAREVFRDQATRDALTGVWTRRAILEILEAELIRAAGNPKSTGVLLLDLDHFKSVNDTYGHLAGDQVLAEAARRLSRQLRSYDAIGRYGGEEFMVVTPGCDENELCELAERLRSAIESKPIRAAKKKINVTLSVGAAIAQAVDGPGIEAIERADVALYAAKKAGRNRFVSATQPQSLQGLFAVPKSVAMTACKIPA